MFAIVMLSVPFFALIAAQTHHGSHKGLAALIMSAAAGAIVAGPLWRMLNGLSHRTVMVVSCLIVSCSGAGLSIAYLMKLDQNVHIHAVALFAATVAASGLQTVRGLYFMDVAPKEQRVRAMTVARSLGRTILVLVSAALAAIAHMHETVWVIVFIVCVCLVTSVLSYKLAGPQ
ncbi:MAG: MFS transporter [Paracoccaceae bacterium]